MSGRFQQGLEKPLGFGCWVVNGAALPPRPQWIGLPAAHRLPGAPEPASRCKPQPGVTPAFPSAQLGQLSAAGGAGSQAKRPGRFLF